jgi:hypothetical protein
MLLIFCIIFQICATISVTTLNLEIVNVILQLHHWESIKEQQILFHSYRNLIGRNNPT